MPVEPYSPPLKAQLDLPQFCPFRLAFAGVVADIPRPCERPGTVRIINSLRQNERAFGSRHGGRRGRRLPRNLPMRARVPLSPFESTCRPGRGRRSPRMDEKKIAFAPTAPLIATCRHRLSAPRRGGRVVEGARLLSEYTVKSRIEGSNPFLSAMHLWQPAKDGLPPPGDRRHEAQCRMAPGQSDAEEPDARSTRRLACGPCEGMRLPGDATLDPRRSDPKRTDCERRAVREDQ